ncbi:hypothetical protein B0I08_101750 [Glaciihabitans tibetensis]|uniref:Uncharacterized protein n=1 Tax=Glaciihabitans tibetensis TaxID=1266600 RepID=A0A2T0VKA5_9MICO|nr:hypothetical protein [Glaciihabitans tibetensis]PRY70613.1 hypothetical protein B0I08_101750 [Glaciihabitans tibetensis]
MSSSHIPAEDVVLEFTYDDGDDATVTVSGHHKGVTALRALIEVGDESNLEKIQASIDAGEIQDETDIEIEFSSGDDTCTVTVAGFTNPQRGLQALEEAGSEETFLELLDAMAADGDDSIQELYDEDDE